MNIIFRPEGPFHRDAENIKFYCLTSRTSHQDVIAICLQTIDSEWSKPVDIMEGGEGKRKGKGKRERGRENE